MTVVVVIGQSVVNVVKTTVVLSVTMGWLAVDVL